MMSEECGDDAGVGAGGAAGAPGGSSTRQTYPEPSNDEATTSSAEYTQVILL